MSCRVLDNKTLVTLNAFEYMGLLNSPLANIRPFFVGLRIFLLCVGGFPPGFPVVCELFDEICFDVCGWLSALSIYVSELFFKQAFAGGRKGGLP